MFSNSGQPWVSETEVRAAMVLPTPVLIPLVQPPVSIISDIFETKEYILNVACDLSLRGSFLAFIFAKFRGPQKLFG